MSVLLVCEDPGGVDVIVPIERRLTELGVAHEVLSSGPGNAVWQRHGIPFVDISAAMREPPDPAAVDAQVARHQPRVVVTATSFPRRVEKLFRRTARARGIPSVMVLDADRTDLYRTDPEEIACRPDLAISIGDRMTAQLAAAGYNTARILTAGHLGLAPIAAAGRGIAEADAAAWKRGFMETSDGRELIVVFSDNITQVFGETGALAEIGYHERIAVPALLRAIAATAGQCGRRYEVVVKLHPKEAPGHFSDLYRDLTGDRLRFREIAACDNLRLIRAADHILGLYSIVMVWSTLLGRPTLSYQPEARQDTLLVTVEEGAAPCCWRAADLKPMVQAFLTDSDLRTQWQRRTMAWRPDLLDGAANVTDAILRLAATPGGVSAAD